MGEFQQTFREELIILKTIKKKKRKKNRGKNASELILQGQNHLDTKTRQGYHTKKKITGQHHLMNTCKNSQQNITTLIPIIH